MSLDIITTHDIRIAYRLTFTIEFTGMTMKLFGLPEYPNIPTERGTVYLRPSALAGAEQDYLLFVKG